MSKNHKPSKVSESPVSGSSAPGNGHHCPKSPSGGHWWHIGSPDGAMSVGVCQYCGEQQRFVNALNMTRSPGARG